MSVDRIPVTRRTITGVAARRAGRGCSTCTVHTTHLRTHGATRGEEEKRRASRGRARGDRATHGEQKREQRMARRETTRKEKERKGMERARYLLSAGGKGEACKSGSKM